jgi:aspartate racemase
MEEAFYRGRLETQHGIRVLMPEEEDRDLVHRVIYAELCRGVVLEPSRAAYREVIHRLVSRGAEGVILGCTEIGLLVSAPDSPVPIFDTTDLHAASAVECAPGTP